MGSYFSGDKKDSNIAEKKYVKMPKGLFWTGIAVGGMILAYIAGTQIGRKSEQSYMPQQQAGQVSVMQPQRQQTGTIRMEESRTNWMLGKALEKYNSGDYSESIGYFKNFIINTGIEEGEFDKYMNYYNLHVDSIGRAGFAPMARDQEMTIANLAHESENMEQFVVGLRENKNTRGSIINNEVSKYALRKICDTLTDQNLSESQRKNSINRVKRTLGQELVLAAIKIMPIRNPLTGKYETTEKVVRDVLGDRFSGTEFAKDPLGVSFDIILGNYSATELKDSVIGYSGGEDEYDIVFRGSTYAPEPTYYDSQGRPVDPSTLPRDRFGNVIPSIGVRQEPSRHDFSNYTESTRRIEGRTGGSREETNIWLRPETKQQKEQERWEQWQPNKEDPRSIATRDAFNKTIDGAKKVGEDATKFLQNLFKPPPEKKKKDGN